MDIDPTLHMRADGSVAPAASSVDVAFSGGGAAPMATMVKAGRICVFLAGYSAGASADGATATYKDVINGVDLRLNADAEGFSDVLVVKTRQAAQDPALAQLKSP